MCFSKQIYPNYVSDETLYMKWGKIFSCDISKGIHEIFFRNIYNKITKNKEKSTLTIPEN